MHKHICEMLPMRFAPSKKNWKDLNGDYTRGSPKPTLFLSPPSPSVFPVAPFFPITGDSKPLPRYPFPLPHPVSLSSLLSLFLWNTLFLSLRFSVATAWSTPSEACWWARIRPMTSEGAEKGGGSYPAPRSSLLEAVGRMWGRSYSLALHYHFSATALANLGAKMLSILPSSKWYPLFLKKVPRWTTHFSMQKRHTLQVDLSKTEPYFEITISNLYSWPEILSNDK